LEAIRWDDTADPRIAFESAVRAGRNRIRRLRPCAFFQIEWIELQESLACRNDGASFHALFAARNAVRLIAADEAWLLPLGTSWLLPAALAEYRLQPVERPADVLRISVPPPADR
jgi:mannose-6-phosphate isomerase class I